MTSWHNETIEDWNDRTRIVGKTGFSALETSVTRQIEHILADKSRHRELKLDGAIGDFADPL